MRIVYLQRMMKLFIFSGLFCLGISASWANEVIPGSEAAGLVSCVAPTADIRRNHMEYLFHKRDQTMHQGIRTPEFSLNKCVACHVAKDEKGSFVPVNEEGQFCQSCHERVGEKLDCFQCHRTTPES